MDPTNNILKFEIVDGGPEPGPDHTCCFNFNFEIVKGSGAGHRPNTISSPNLKSR